MNNYINSIINIFQDILNHEILDFIIDNFNILHQDKYKSKYYRELTKEEIDDPIFYTADNIDGTIIVPVYALDEFDYLFVAVITKGLERYKLNDISKRIFFDYISEYFRTNDTVFTITERDTQYLFCITLNIYYPNVVNKIAEIIL